MKKTNLFLVVIAVVIFATGSLLAFPNLDNDPDGDKDSKKAKVKIVTIVDGVKTVTDTLIDLGKDIEILGLENIEINIDSILNEVEMTLKNIQINGDVEGSDQHVFISIGGDSINSTSDIKLDIDLDEIMKTIEVSLENLEESLDNIGKRKKICKTIIISEEDGEENVKVIECNGKGNIDIDLSDILKSTEKSLDNIDLEKIISETIIITEEDGKENVRIITKDGNGNIDVDLSEIMKTVEMSIDSDDSGTKTYTVVIESSSTELDEDDYKSLESKGIKNTKGNQLKLKDLSISPNPSDGNISLDFISESKKTLKINIYGLDGKKVYSEKMKNFEGKYSKKINLSSEKSGTYFVNITQDKKQTTKKIIFE